LTFNQALDPTTAENVRNYVITDPCGHRLRVLRAVYDPDKLTVTLHPAQRINVHDPYGFTVVRKGPTGLRNLYGQLLDGKHTGKPGSDYHLVLTWRQLLGDVTLGFLIQYHVLAREPRPTIQPREPRPAIPADHARVHAPGLFTRSVSLPRHRLDRHSQRLPRNFRQGKGGL
jgi:hypothetical protein